MKYTDDITLMHDYELIKMREGNPYGIIETPRCKYCAAYWIAILRHTNYNGEVAAREICSARDKDRVSVQPKSPEETLAVIKELQSA